MDNFDDRNRYNNGSNDNFQPGEMPDDIGNLIKKNIEKKAEKNIFRLDIEDEDFYKIPDFENNIPPPEPIKRSQNEMSHNLYSNNITRKSTNKRYDRNRRNIKPTQPDDTVKEYVPTKTRRKKQSTKVFGGVFYAITVVIASVLLSIFLIQSLGDFLGLYKKEHFSKIIVSENATLDDITKSLKDNKIINQSVTFKLYSTLRKKNDNFRVGEYTLNASMSYDELLGHLRSSNTTKEVVSVTIIEGRTIVEMGDILKESKVTTPDKFFKAVREREGFYEWEAQIPDDDLRFFKYEGYLFPDTHTVYVNEEGRSLAGRYIDGFNTKIINADMEQRLQELGITLDELITLASIVERESSGYIDDMDKVAAVFYNRLNNPSLYPKLESDVTINYVEDNIKPFVTTQAEFEKYAAAYNTYKVDGLPIGPICNPGERAIRATLYPAENFEGIYFFITDVNDKFYYAKTYEEHLANIVEAEKIKDEEGKSKVGGTTTGDQE